MDQNERQSDNKLTIDRDAQINLVVNAPGDGEDSIDLGRVFHNMKLKRRVFAWVLVLCLTVGVCAPLLLYQFNKPMLTVASVVTLKYDVKNTQIVNGEEVATYTPVTDLTAPDGTPLDLSMVTSAYVLQKALNGMELSQPVTLAALRDNITVERVLTEESRQAQELASKMVTDKDSKAYDQVRAVDLKYDSKFTVKLANGFSDGTNKDSGVKLELTDRELQVLLDRILDAYNQYLVETYADRKLPDDEISVIDTEALDLLESLEKLQKASDNLYEYCENQPESLRKYRSSRDGRNLEDWMQTIQTGREVSIDYLYSNVYTNTIVRKKQQMATSYQYQLQNSQTQLDVVNEQIDTVKSILKDYKNDEISVAMQESDTTKSTKTTTDYYNDLVLQQSAQYKKAAELETAIADLNDKAASLEGEGAAAAASEDALIKAEAELERVVASSQAVYEGVRDHMEELIESTYYTDYAAHTVPQGKLDNFLTANLKGIIIGAAAGAVVACGLWFLAGLAPEFRRNRKEEENGKGAA